MDIRFLESLLFVVKTGSIANAAREQGLTATAISQRMRVLESELGVELLSRNAHSVRPSQACLDILPRAQQLIGQAKELKNDIDPSGFNRTIKLGAISTALIDFVPDTLRVLSKKAPQIKVDITPGTSQSLLEALLKEEIDIAIAVKPKNTLPKYIQSRIIAKQKLVLIGTQDMSCSVNKILSSQPLILYNRKSYAGQIAWNWILEQNIRTSDIKVLCELDPIETIASLAQEKMGVAVIPYCQNLLKQYKKLRIKTLKQTQEHSRKIVMMWNHHSLPKELIDVLKVQFLS